MRIEEKLKGLRTQESLASHTNFEIGGPADYFFAAQETADLIVAIRAAKDLDISYYILGDGCNVLVSDAGFRGLIIKVASKNFKLKNHKIIAEAGVNLQDLVRFSLKNNLEGLENLSDIPGTVGGAIYGNAGAFGVSLGDFVEKVKVLNPQTLKIETYLKKDCLFSYRKSIFKKNKKVILEAVFNLRKIKDQQLLLEKIAQIKKIRARHPYKCCAGSIFKNVKIKDLKNKTMRREIPADCFQFDEIKTACLIEKIGLKGEKRGRAQISPQHANFIVNTGKARAQEVLDLIDLIRKKVYQKYHLVLETEIQFVGFKRKPR